MNNQTATGVHDYIDTPHNRVLVEYYNIENPRNLELVRRIMARCSFLFPRWIEKINLQVHDEIPNSPSADATCFYDRWEYGYANINLATSFFERTEKRQFEILVHELLHVAQGKMLAFVTRYFLGYMVEKNKDLFDALKDLHTEVNEEFTENMTRVIVDNLIEAKDDS